MNMLAKESAPIRAKPGGMHGVGDFGSTDLTIGLTLMPCNRPELHARHAGGTTDVIAAENMPIC